MNKEAILDAYKFRHACKVFDENRKISEEDLHLILETGRLSPSSFGMEAWRFLVITDDELKKKLKPHCWNQAQIDTNSHLLILLTQTANATDDAYVAKMFGRRNLDKEATAGYIERYKNYVENKVKAFFTRYFYNRHLKKQPVYEWLARQTYIAAANMATTAAMIGIDSCFIEGFEKDAVEKTLGIDTSKEEVSVLLPLGYRIKEQPPKYRKSLEEVAEFI